MYNYTSPKKVSSIAGLGSRSRSEPGVFGSLEPEPLEERKKKQEPEPLGKKSRAGADKN